MKDEGWFSKESGLELETGSVEIQFYRVPCSKLVSRGAQSP